MRMEIPSGLKIDFLFWQLLNDPTIETLEEYKEAMGEEIEPSDLVTLEIAEEEYQSFK